MERIQKIIAASGICSRRKAEELILNAKVKLNGIMVTDLGTKASFEDDIEVEGKKIKKEEKVVYLLNKPKNYLSSVSDDRGRNCVSELIETKQRLFPIGRLDFSSSGLLLMTNDGELTNMIIHPKYKIPKIYEVTINGLITKQEIEKLSAGVLLDGKFKTSESKIKLIKLNQNKKISFLEVTIYEGYNRQIRKMFETLNYTVTRLHRIKEANIELGNLKSGEYRKLKPFEVVSLKKYIETKIH